jgi:deoxyribodipyrimidine photolyase-related protein
LTKPTTRFRHIRLILGDQLNINHSWFQQVQGNVLYVMMEIKPESEYVQHHIQKIVGIFLNMRNFANQLQRDGHHIEYLKINDPDNQHSFLDNLSTLITRHKITHGAWMEADEYRLDQQLRQDFQSLKFNYEVVSAEHFFTERSSLDEMFPAKSSVTMENFYRKMRTQHNILMNNGEPEGGKWNYDQSNRKKLPTAVKPPDPLVFNHDVSQIIHEINEAGLQYFGRINEKAFDWPDGRKEALDMLRYFLDELLVHFGTYQDAITTRHRSLFHSRLSFALNLKLIDPGEVISATEDHWKEHREKIDVAQVEGFIRQIIGWREFMRGVYWKHMPEYERLNFFDHQRSLPSFFWNGQTKMHCLNAAIGQSLDDSYAHHIQRLMVIGNFCLLAGIHPDEVDKWYLGVYADAYQWVQITNTRGMSQYADGGIVGTKPYVSSANYINKMGDNCKKCHYNPHKRVGENACPFNSLYWRFLAVHEQKLASNPRMAMMYRVWNTMDNKVKNTLIDQANYYLDYIEQL